MDAGEIVKHNTTKSCWVVINSQVYDVTSYLNIHPGGAAILLKQGGRDATAEFSKIHSSDVLQYLPNGSCLGPIDSETLDSLVVQTKDSASLSAVEEGGDVPHLARCVITDDFEPIAKSVLPTSSWSYVTSSSNSGLSLASNLGSWSTIKFRPRVLRDVGTVTTTTSILGRPSPFPFFVMPMGLLGRAHVNGEVELVKGFARSGVHGVISTVSSKPANEIADSLTGALQDLGLDRNNPSSSQLHFQLYVPSDRTTAGVIISRAKAAGFRTLWVTVDTAVLGKRTVDRRQLVNAALELGLEEEALDAGLGIRTHVIQGQIRSSLTWDDLKWIKEEWGGPVVVKGLQCAEDAKLAMEHGCQGILLSNHGGRQIHSAPDALSTLLEIREYCPEVLENLEVFVDGGLRDGSDVLKALCLGAKAVGVGRPFFYALAAYGSLGVERCVNILSEELQTAMRLLGVTSVDQVHPDMVNATHLINQMWRPTKSRL